MSAHLIDGEFQSDKYPTTPRGKVPLSVKDRTAQDLLWEYAQRRREIDAEFSDDLEAALRQAGYKPPLPSPPATPGSPALAAPCRSRTEAALDRAEKALRQISQESGFGVHGRMRAAARDALADIATLREGGGR